MPMRIDALIFDIDGTLWDSCEAVCASWRDSLRRRYGCFDPPSVEQVRGVMGQSPDEIASQLFSCFGTHAREVFDALAADECGFIRAHGAELYTGACETLRALARERRLFIVSNCMPDYIDCFLDCSGLGDVISGSLCAGDTGLGKAENIRKIITDNDISRALYIGDTRADELAARAAPCGFIHAAYGFGRAQSPDAVLERISDLEEITASLERS